MVLDAAKFNQIKFGGYEPQVGGVNPSFGSFTIGANRSEGGANYDQYVGELDTTNGTGVIGSFAGTNPDGSFAAQDIAKKLGMPKLMG